MLKQTNLAPYQGQIGCFDDLSREGLWMRSLVLAEPVTIGAEVFSAGTDGFCLGPIDDTPVPDFPFATAIPFLTSSGKEYGSLKWDRFVPVPWGTVLADGNLPGPMRRWTELSPEEVASLQGIVQQEGLLLIAGCGRQEAEGTCGTAASVACDGDGPAATITVSWTTRGEVRHHRMPADACAVASGSDWVFIYRHHDAAVLINRACVHLALQHWAGTPGDRGSFIPASAAPVHESRERDQHPAAPRNIVAAFIQHDRDPEPTAAALARDLFGPHRRSWKPLESDAAVRKRRRYQAAHLAARCRQAVRGTAAAQRDLGLVLLDGGYGAKHNPAVGVGWLERAAEQGDPRAQTRLGYAYGDGEGGLTVDVGRMVALFTAAAKAGHARAAAALSTVYYNDHYGLRSETLEVHWMQRAAELGDAMSAYGLSGAYLRGRGGLPIDEALSDQWLERSEVLNAAEAEAEAEADRREQALIDRYEDTPMPTPHRIAIIGASGTGKTTLVQALAEHLPGIPIIPEQATVIITEWGEIPRLMAPERRAAFQAEIMRRAVALEQGHQGSGFIADRCVIDNLAYARAMPNASELLQQARDHLASQPYTLVVLVPIGIPLVDDRVRTMDPAIQAGHEAAIIDLLGQLGVPYHRLQSLPLVDRVAEVLRSIDG